MFDQRPGGSEAPRSPVWARIAAAPTADSPEIEVCTVPERLTLITCGGSFNRSKRSYVDNVVVTAVPN